MSGDSRNSATQPLLSAPVSQDDQEDDMVWTPADSPRVHFQEDPVGPTPSAVLRNLSASSKHSLLRETRARKTAWTLIDSFGKSTVFEADKRALVQRFNLRLPIRDMRLVDPNLLTSETGKIIVRDCVILVSMEHIRLILLADEVIVIRESGDVRPLCSVFTDALQKAIVSAAAERERYALGGTPHEDPRDDAQGGRQRREVAPLPFELVVLEMALGDICSVLDRMARDLDLQCGPALEALTRDVSTDNLERVRKVKTRHQRLLARVTTVREELERFLEDDDDMAKMCLTRRAEAEASQQTAAGSEQSPGSVPQLQPAGNPGRSHGLQRSGSAAYRRMSLSTRTSTQVPGSPRGGELDNGEGPEESEAEEALDAVENLLESYFVQIDGTFDKLQAVGEYIEDTEEFINIELDSSRNRLIRLEIILTAGTFALAIFTLVGGVLGENVIIPPAITRTVTAFWGVNGITAVICIAVFWGFMIWMRAKKLL